MKKYIITLLLLLCISAGMHAQVVVTDPLNTAQGVINSVNTAATVNSVVDQVSKLQQTLDFVRKVSSTVRNISYFKELIHRQGILNSQCVTALKEIRKLNLTNGQNLIMSVESVVTNNAEIISMASTILTSNFNMNDSERLEQLDACLKRLREEETKLRIIRQITYNTQEIQYCLKSLTK